MNALRRIALAGLALLAGAPAFAASEAVKTYRQKMLDVATRQKTYESKKFEEDLRAAADTLVAPFRERGGPDAPKVIDYDFSGYADVYERYAGYGNERGLIAVELAAANDVEAATQLVDSLLGVLGNIATLDREIREVKPLSRGIVDQGPGIKRYSAWLERDQFVAALRSLTDPAALEYLVKKGYTAAKDADKKNRSCEARVALLDALTAPNAAFAEEVAAGDDPRLRIAALEALSRVAPGPATKGKLQDAERSDACYAVRAAATALLAPEKTPAADDAPAFFTIPVEAKRVLILLDTSSPMVKPVDVDLLKTKSQSEWHAIAEKDRDYVTQLGLMCSETRDFLQALPAGAKFDILDLGDGDRITSLSPRGLIDIGDAARQRAAEFLGSLVAGGYVSQIEGLWEASRRAGVDPFGAALPNSAEADRILLVSNGVPHGGPIMYGPAILDDVARRHRFLRIPVDTVRLDVCDTPAEDLMRGIVEITGGVHRHRSHP